MRRPRRHHRRRDSKLRSGSYFPAWLLERRKPAEQPVAGVMANSYADGAHNDAPDAVHIVDRWHNPHNLAETVEHAGHPAPKLPDRRSIVSPCVSH